MIRFPAPLRPGGTVAVTAPSSGVPASLRPRLDLAVARVEVSATQQRITQVLS